MKSLGFLHCTPAHIFDNLEKVINLIKAIKFILTGVANRGSGTIYPPRKGNPTMETVSTKRREGAVSRPTPEPKPRKGLVYHTLEDVEVEHVHWLWYPYIPAAKLTMLEGDPGMGKSFITCSIAADLSAGRALPGQKSPLPPQKVLILSAEDGLGDTVRPRIEAMAGDLRNIIVSDDFFILDAQGIRELEDVMRDTAATIVFMDPIVAYMGGKVDMHRANEVRQLMTALSEAAKRTGAAIVAVRHLRKSPSGKPVGKAIYSGIGSIDFTAAVRSVIQVQETSSGQRFLYHAKHNLTPKGPSLAYGIGDGKFIWGGELSEEDVNAAQKVSTKPKAVAAAERFLFDALRDGPRTAVEIAERAAVAGIAQATLSRAKKGFAISRKTPEGWVWELEGREGMGDPVQGSGIGDQEAEFARLLADAKARLTSGSGIR